MKQYEVTKHAIDRTVERLGINREHAKGHLLNLMQTAYYVGQQSNANGRITKIFDHINSRTRLLVNDSAIVTVYPMADPLDATATELPDEMKTALRRKANAMIRRIKRETRALNVQLAEKNLEIAQLELNRAKARSNKVIASIDEKISVLKSEYSELAAKRSELTEKEKGVAAYV
ncbi:hypothetical protein B4090_3995 [Bacillus licheniformis]|uniref:hypothetical protein n=1 Tax=Bacillus subtilis group TaxID=653685 RepID=UPI0007792769|nr:MULTISPECIES: hypothetical protein [Bacillus subtilis group]KYC77827.1 hypothetical protein B4090_3995 [Bacillus licheniformis]MBG9882750.1 hypothetical protein [Bacillus paralicheniformis]MCQ5303179.1 DUF724 domain-containing protein [Bacillus licheniformis]TWK51998.1 hypothetical protein CHCC20344_0813 [Bacillus licheniformis]TWM03604.1 hypothetical protein CHCC15139_2207 [Bacillus licheniformis]